MDRRRSYDETAQAYAHGVRDLFATPAVKATDRGGPAPAAGEDLAPKAESLAPISSDLTQAALVQLANSDPKIRAQASTDLLAKALADLEVSQLLYKAAVDEQSGASPFAVARAGAQVDRGRGSSAVDTYLDILTHREGHSQFAAGADRAAASKSVPEAQIELRDGVDAALQFITEDAAKAGQNALKGLVGLGLKNLGQAAGIVGMDVARYLGLGEKVSRLYRLFQSYVAKAYEAILALIGNTLAQTMADKVVAWFEQVQNGTEFTKLLQGLYATEQTGAKVATTIQNSKANLDHYAAAITDVADLRNRVSGNIALADKFVTDLNYLTLIPLAVLPQAQLLLAAGYIVLGTYVILAGGDAVDAPSFEQFNYTQGVIEILQARQI